MTDVDPTMDADTRARVAASDANLAGIVAGRRKVARALLATNLAPAAEVRKGWEPVRQHVQKDPHYRPTPVRPVTKGANPIPGQSDQGEL